MKSISSLLIFITFFLCIESFAEAVKSGRPKFLEQSNCQSFNHTLSQQWQELNSLYKKIDPEFSKLTAENTPYFALGSPLGSSRDLVVLIHGYLGSPFEMNRMAQSIQDKGYNILNELIPGYGFSGRIANQFTQDYWNKYFDVRYKAVFQCFKRVHFIGFSTGGLIIHKFLMTNPQLTAASVHLVSPFYSPTLKLISIINQWFSLLKPEVSLDALYISTLEAKELKIMMTYPDHYLKEAPYLNMNEIVKSGQEVIDSKSTIKNSSPVTVYFTSKDLVMDYDVTRKLIDRDFLNPKFVDYSNTEAPHHLFRPEVSDVAVKFEKYLLSFF